MSFRNQFEQHNLSLNNNFNFSMYIINIIHHLQHLRTRWFVSEISLVRCAHSFDFRYLTNSMKYSI